MMLFLPIYLWTALTILIPLNLHLPSRLLPGLTSDLWNGQVLLLLTVQIFLYLILPSNAFNRRLLRYSLMSSLVYLLLFVIQHNRNPLPAELLRFILIIWLIPLIDLIIKKIGHLKAQYLFLSILVIHAMWGLSHFIIQHDLNLYLVGESRINPELPGVAKFIINFADSEDASNKAIRAYGPYPHPNILGGTLAMGIITAAALLRGHTSRPLFIITGVLFIGLIVTFSRSAWLAVLTGLLVVWNQFRKNSDNRSMERTFLLLITITVLVFTPLIFGRVTDPQDVAAIERSQGVKASWQVIAKHPWWGSGAGRYQDTLQTTLSADIAAASPWKIAPVHSVPLLIIAEYGILGTGIMILPTVLILRPYLKKIWPALLPLAPLLLFDHYLATQLAPVVFLLVFIRLASYLPSPEPRLETMPGPATHS